MAWGQSRLTCRRISKGDGKESRDYFQLWNLTLICQCFQFGRRYPSSRKGRPSHTQLRLYSGKDWLEAVVSGIKLLSEDLKLKGQARFIFPGSFLLTKTIRVPRVEKDKQDKIVEFELSQKMPFPLADLIWDYQVIDDDGVEQEILAFAVKPEVAESFCEKLIELGLSPVQITPAPILDYNALRSSGIGLDESEILVVNMGAKSTNLLFINPTGFLIRSIAVGGNALTQNLADRLGILFEKAEEVKKSYFSGQMVLSPEDPNLQNIESCAQQFLARASQEITRSIVTYKRLKKGKSPERIYLAGRGALLRNLPEYISQSQQLSIDYFDPTKTLQVGNGVSSEMKGLLPFMLSEPIGLASTLLSDDKSKGFAQVINLLPSSKISSLGFRKRSPISAWRLCFSPFYHSLACSILGTIKTNSKKFWPKKNPPQRTCNRNSLKLN